MRRSCWGVDRKSDGEKRARAHPNASPTLFDIGAGGFFVVEDVAEGILVLPAPMYGVVNVRSRRTPGVPEFSDHVTPLDLLADLDVRSLQEMTIHSP